MKMENNSPLERSQDQKIKDLEIQFKLQKNENNMLSEQVDSHL